MLRAFISIFILTLIVFSAIVYLSKPELIIIDTPISFTQKRIDLTQAYIKEHYGLEGSIIDIDPQMIVLHWTEDNNISSSFDLFNPEELPTQDDNVAQASSLNVSVHFLIDREGHIYRLMPETKMARHVIGLNYSSIGIENVGGAKINGVAQADLTDKQLTANIKLVRYLKNKHPKIHYLIGHYEYRNFEHSPLWLEKDPDYRTEKTDPNPLFVDKVHAAVFELGLSREP